MKYFVFIGMIISLTGASFYIRDMLRGKTKPNRITWMMWAIAPLIAAGAAISSGVTWAVIPVFMSGFSPLMIFIVSLLKKEAYWKISKFDIGCGVMSAFALILWLVTKQPTIAIIFSIASDFLAGVPTIIKSWKHPETETNISYIGGVLAASTSFFAISNWNFSSIAFPTYLILNSTIMLFSINHKKIIKILANIFKI